MKRKPKKESKPKEKVMNIFHWDVKEFIPNILSKTKDGFSYYVWQDLPKEAMVNELTMSIGDTVYRAQDLVGKSKISTKFEYTFLGFDGDMAKLRKSKFDMLRTFPLNELCKKDMSTYAKTKKALKLQYEGKIFYELDKKTKKRVDKKLKG